MPTRDTDAGRTSSPSEREPPLRPAQEEARRLLLLVRLSSERERQAVRQDCSFASDSSLAPRSWSSSRAIVRGSITETLAMTREENHGSPGEVSDYRYWRALR
jgi:hypothetical protein